MEFPNSLERNEPLFAQYWLSRANRGDPQYARWVEYEAQQLDTANTRVRTITENLFPVTRKRVLDLGSQWGATCVALSKAGAEAVGIDISDELAEGSRIRAKEQDADAEFVTGAAEALPFPEKSFDAVVCSNVIEHVKSHGLTIREIGRVLKPRGDVFLDGPNRLAPGNFLCDPHYQMIGISLLPESLGRFYVVRLRKYPAFDVGTFPIAKVIEQKMRRQRLEPVASSSGSGLRGALRFNLMPLFWIHARRRA